MEQSDQITQRRPPWLKVKLPGGEGYRTVLRTARSQKLNTVCEDARCPNIGECWGRKTATFMILGSLCTRACGFCSVQTGRPQGLDRDEPRRIAEAIRSLGIRHAVITSVTRDDLPDGGAEIFAETLRETRRVSPGTTLEILIPDFRGKLEALQKVWDATPDVLAHNIECVARLQKKVRRGASYECSTFVLAESKRRYPERRIKSGIQVGHGETWDELLETLNDMARINLDIFTIGQYLQPTREHLPVQRFYTPEEFGQLDQEARQRGIPYVYSGPLVRSSYRAEEAVNRLIGNSSSTAS